MQWVKSRRVPGGLPGYLACLPRPLHLSTPNEVQAVIAGRSEHVVQAALLTSVHERERSTRLVRTVSNTAFVAVVGPVPG